MWNKNNVATGDLVLADNDTDWGVIRSISDEGVMAFYASLDTNYLIYWDDIAKVRRNGLDLDPNSAFPPPPAPSGMALSPGIDLNAQRKVAPGHIVTWSRAASQGYNENRMFVVLAFTKNSQKTLVNIFPLNGVQPGEGNNNAQNLQWYKVQVINCKPVAFPAPLIKRTVKV